MLDKEYIEKQLSKHIDSDIMTLLSENNCIIAGGVFTSILTNSEVNDIDVYFKSKDDFVNVMKEIYNSGCDFQETKYLDKDGDELCLLSSHDLIYISHTDKSVTLKQNGGCLIQFTHQGFYSKPKHIFKDFDFTVNMIAYDVASGKVYYNDQALQHLSQRVLITNGGTKFPLMSVLRVDKYQKRGYTIGKKEMIKLLVGVNAINMTCWEDVEKHIGGMYSLRVNELFKKDVAFSLQEVLQQLCDLEVDIYKHFKNQYWSDFKVFVNELVVKHNQDKYDVNGVC